MRYIYCRAKFLTFIVSCLKFLSLIIAMIMRISASRKMTEGITMACQMGSSLHIEDT